MFKSRINAKRTILAAEAPKEEEKKPKKPAKTKKRKGKGEDEEIDFNDAFSDDEGIVDGEKSEASDVNDGSDSDQSSDSEPPKEEVKPAPKKPLKKLEMGKKGSLVDSGSVDGSREMADDDASLGDGDDSSIASIFNQSDESDHDMPKAGQKRQYGQMDHKAHSDYD